MHQSKAVSAVVIYSSKNLNVIKMHKIVLCAFALVALAAAAPQNENDHSQTYILKQDSNISPDGYQFDFETSDGTSRQESGTLKQLDDEHQALEVTGSYKYVAPDGLTYSVTFTADQNGFQPQEHVEHQQ